MQTDHCYCDTVTKTIRCEVCGEEIPMPLGTIRWVTRVMKAFVSEHRTKQHEGGRCLFATATPPVPTQDF